MVKWNWFLGDWSEWKWFNGVTEELDTEEWWTATLSVPWNYFPFSIDFFLAGVPLCFWQWRASFRCWLLLLHFVYTHQSKWFFSFNCQRALQEKRQTGNWIHCTSWWLVGWLVGLSVFWSDQPNIWSIGNAIVYRIKRRVQKMAFVLDGCLVEFVVSCELWSRWSTEYSVHIRRRIRDRRDRAVRERDDRDFLLIDSHWYSTIYGPESVLNADMQ